MRARNALAVAAIAVLGIAAAAGMGLLANEISGDSIGLAAEPLRAGRQLAPAEAGRDRADRRGDDNARSTTTTRETTSTAEATTTPTTTTELEPGDDHGGGIEPGDDSSGSGSGSDDSSGSGSDDSGSDD